MCGDAGLGGSSVGHLPNGVIWSEDLLGRGKVPSMTRTGELAGPACSDAARQLSLRRRDRRAVTSALAQHIRRRLLLVHVLGMKPG